jgi:hypothetical protein
MTDEAQQNVDDDYGVIHIGWDKITVYGNRNGDVCIAQESPIEGCEVIICAPLLYCQALINNINQTIEDYEN